MWWLSLILLAQVYALAETASHGDYLVRFDSVTFEYVAKIQRYSNSGTFDRVNGDFFLVDNDRGHLYRYSNVHNLAGSTNKDYAADLTSVNYVYDYSSGWHDK